MFLRILTVSFLSFSLFSANLLAIGDFPFDTAYAQEEEVTTTGAEEAVEEETLPSVRLLSVMVNNESVEVLDGDRVLVKPDDAVRLSGAAEPNSEVYIYFAEKELTTTVREDGYWFILFSITDMEDGQYAIRAGDGEIEESEKV